MKTTVSKYWNSVDISTLDDHFSGSYTRIDLTAILYIRPLIDVRLSHRSHRCLKLENAIWAFGIRQDTSFDMRPPNETQLPNNKAYLPYPILLLRKQTSASSQSSTVIAFYASKVQNASQIYLYYGSDNRWILAIYLRLHSVIHHHPHIVSQTISCTSKYQLYYCQMRVKLFPQPQPKLKRKTGRGQSRRKSLLVEN